MTKYQSPMRADLTSAECDRIDEAWARLTLIAHSLGHDAQPVDMLGDITDLIMAAYEVRQAINDGWYAANYRRFPPAEPTKRVSFRRSPDAAALLSEVIGISPERIMELVTREHDKTKGTKS